MAYTSGPWSVGHTHRRNYGACTLWEVGVHVGEGGTRGNCFATVFLGGDGAIAASEEASLGNARLIAAAPDLLSALQAHDSYMRSSGYADPDDIALHPKAAANWTRVRAAIAKAEGR